MDKHGVHQGFMILHDGSKPGHVYDVGSLLYCYFDENLAIYSLVLTFLILKRIKITPENLKWNPIITLDNPRTSTFMVYPGGEKLQSASGAPALCTFGYMVDQSIALFLW